MNYIKTIGELKPYIGKLIVSESKFGYTAWMQRLIKIDEMLLDNASIDGICLRGNFVTEIKPLCYSYGVKNRITNAQEIIREPTKEEYEKYVAFWSKCRLLGYAPLTIYNKKLWILENQIITKDYNF